MVGANRYLTTYDDEYVEQQKEKQSPRKLCKNSSSMRSASSKTAKQKESLMHRLNDKRNNHKKKRKSTKSPTDSFESMSRPNTKRGHEGYSNKSNVISVSPKKVFEQSQQHKRRKKKNTSTNCAKHNKSSLLSPKIRSKSM